MRTTGKAYGPYEDRAGYRVVIKAGSKRTSQVFATRRAAERAVACYREEFTVNEVTVADGLQKYMDVLGSEMTKEGRRTITGGISRMFPDQDVNLLDVDRRLAQRLYDDMRTRPLRNKKPPSVATHHESLKSCKRLWAWLLRREIVEANPWELVDLVGQRKRGKAQLTLDQARQLMNACLESDEHYATMVLCCLVLGLRAGEVAAITPACLDDNGTVLLIPGTKTQNAARPVDLPGLLQERVAAMAAAGTATRFSVAYAVEKWCGKAKVPPVCPHGLRGTHASLARKAGATGPIVAAQLGHASEAITRAHYLAPGSAETSQVREGLRVLLGGKSVP